MFARLAPAPGPASWSIIAEENLAPAGFRQQERIGDTSRIAGAGGQMHCLVATPDIDAGAARVAGDYATHRTASSRLKRLSPSSELCATQSAHRAYCSRGVSVIFSSGDTTVPRTTAIDLLPGRRFSRSDRGLSCLSVPRCRRLQVSGGHPTPHRVSWRRSRTDLVIAADRCTSASMHEYCMRRHGRPRSAAADGDGARLDRDQATTTSATSSLPRVSGPSAIAMAKLSAAPIVPTSIGIA